MVFGRGEKSGRGQPARGFFCLMGLYFRKRHRVRNLSMFGRFCTNRNPWPGKRRIYPGFGVFHQRTCQARHRWLPAQKAFSTVSAGRKSVPTGLSLFELDLAVEAGVAFQQVQKTHFDGHRFAVGRKAGLLVIDIFDLAWQVVDGGHAGVSQHHFGHF